MEQTLMRRLGLISRGFFAVIAVTLATSLATPARAGSFQLIDFNSVVDVDSTSGIIPNWTVDGVDQLFDEWFFISIDGGPVQAISLAGGWVLGVEGTTDANFNGFDETYFGRFFDPTGSVGIEIGLRLLGGNFGTGTSDLAEQLFVFSADGLAHDIDFFEYSDFDLGGTIGNDLGAMNTASDYFQVDVVNGWGVEIDVTSTDLVDFEVGNFPFVLFDVLAGTLNGNPGPVFGDVSQAYQWSTVVSPTNDLIISKNKLIFRAAVPEPSSVVLMGLGGLGLLGVVGRRMRKSA
jgi:hypothetical protein